MKERGFTLVELIVVMAVMVVLLAIAGLNWNEMTTKYAIEDQIKMIHADLMEIRLQALYTKTPCSILISGKDYKAYASTDTSVAPLVTKQLKYPVVWNSAGALTFDDHGLLRDSERTLCILPYNDTNVVNKAQVDSIVISQTRINLGKRTGGDCISDNINQK